MITFEQKIVVITGAASGLGLGIAKEIIKRKGTVILVDIDSQRLQEIQNDQPDGICETYTADVTDFSQIKKVLSDVAAKHHRIDYFFNNAGLGGTLPFEEATLDHWKKIIDLNLYGVIHGITAIYPIMKKQKSGHIINTSSIAGLIPFQGQALYNTTKFAVTGLSLTLEQELKKDGIAISILCPGMVKTRIFYKPLLGEEAPEEYVKIPKDAISVEEAVADIMNGLEKKKRIIITPKFLKGLYFKYRLLGR